VAPVTDAHPPTRFARRWVGPGGSWSYDTWGHNGRPVILLHAVLFDRTMWWPAAADLRRDCTMIAVDLPGHGASPARARYDPEALVAELAQLLHDLGMTRAPIVVGHGSSAALAALFARRFAAHACVTVDAVAPPMVEPPVTAEHVDTYLAALRAEALPPYFHTLVAARPSPALLEGYARCLSAAAQACGGGTPRLQVYSQPPPASTGRQRSEVYHVPGRFAHLADVRRFGYDLRSVL
jgi:pimeloyl-ACP methyl ester carboxylesterase